MASLLSIAVMAALISTASAQSYQMINTMTTAHGTLGSIAYLALFPMGAIIIRTAFFGQALKVHIAIQVLAYATITVGAGLGIYIAIYDAELGTTHAKIGLTLFAILFFQAPTGLWHHMWYKKEQKRTAPSYWHIFIGRCAIIIGMVNGGLGLKLTGNPTKYYVAYGVVAGVMGTLYIASIVYGESSRRRPLKSVELEASASTETSDVVTTGRKVEEA